MNVASVDDAGLARGDRTGARPPTKRFGWVEPCTGSNANLVALAKRSGV
jgi:hypothetical protein